MIFPETLVASASGFKISGVDGLAPNMVVDCHYTGKDVGECLLAAGTGTEATTVTQMSGTPINTILVPVSDKVGGASPTGDDNGNDNGNSTGSGNGSGNSTSSGNGNGDKDGGNSAAGVTTGKQLMFTFGGVALGVLAIF